MRGDGASLQAVLQGVPPPLGGRGARLAARLRDAGVSIDVADVHGRRLLSAGAVPRSWVGGLLAGSTAVRPTARGALTVIRARRVRRAPRTPKES